MLKLQFSLKEMFENISGIIYRNDNIEVEGVDVTCYLMNFIWKKKVPDRAKIIHLNNINFSFPFANKYVTIIFHGVG